MNYFVNTHNFFFPISSSHSKLQYIFFRKLSERYFIVKKKLLWPLQCMELNPTQLITYNSLKKLMERFTLITYDISFNLHICCIMDGM